MTQVPTSTNASADLAVGRGVRLDDVSHKYQSSAGPVDALSGFSLNIGPGEFVVVVGPSGCGKSTLLEILAGLRRPTSGTVSIGESRVIGPSKSRAVVFQQSTSLLPWLNVGDNVGLGLRFRGVAKSQIQSRVHQELSRVGLVEFAGHKPYELSGGMQQRCQLARALAVDPEVLLLDEPFGALDALTRESLQVELRRIWRETRKTIVMVTHSVEEAVFLGTRVIAMSSRPGRIVADIAQEFSTSDLSLSQLRSESNFVTAADELRRLLHQR
ncbi:MAG: ABC transporter ATP-binding protein [Actinomycetota bacterium]